MISDPPPPIIRVLGVDLLVREGTKEEMRDEAGILYPMQGMILYDEDQGDDELRDTILHELIHFVEYKLGFKLKHELIQILAAVFAAILSDNEELTEWAKNSDVELS
jgi:hypothetical protein